MNKQRPWDQVSPLQVLEQSGSLAKALGRSTLLASSDSACMDTSEGGPLGEMPFIEVLHQCGETCGFTVETTHIPPDIGG